MNATAETIDVVIDHNPECGTSRNTLAMIRNAAIGPQIIEYLQTPAWRNLLTRLVAQAGLARCGLLREKGTPLVELGVQDEALTDDRLMDAMMEHPMLINRPLVVTPLGVRPFRPSELVLDILPDAQRAPFVKEDGKQVIDEAGKRVCH